METSSRLGGIDSQKLAQLNAVVERTNNDNNRNEDFNGVSSFPDSATNSKIFEMFHQNKQYKKTYLYYFFCIKTHRFVII